MEYILSKGVIWGVNLAQVSKVPFGLPKGGLPGGECCAPCFNLETLRVSEQI